MLESRELQGTFRTDFHSGDSLTVDHARLFELLPAPFQIAQTVHKAIKQRAAGARKHAPARPHEVGHRGLHGP